MSETRTATLLGGRYRLQREIAHGGMATVYEAVDEVLERTVAVKVLHPHLAADGTFLDRFLREARAAAALSHPNVVSVYDWGHDEGDRAYLVMEYVDGPSLRDVLRRRGRLTAGEAAAILGPAAAGIAAAHQRGLIHRDVKPENVLITSTGDVKVTDFGLARATAATTHTFAPGSLVGSPHYLSPEAVRDEVLDARTDVYALGVVLYECVVGAPPFEGDSAMATAMRHTRETVPPPSDLVDVPDEVDELVAHATAPDPVDRYADAGAFGAELRGAIEATPPAGATSGGTVVIPPETTDTVVPGPERPETPVPKGPRPRRRLRRGVRALLLVLALAATMAGGAYALWAFLLAPVTQVPDVVNEPEAAAIAELRDAGFEAEVTSRPYDAQVAEGIVLEQDPTDTARLGTTVALTVSNGPRPVDVPPVQGRPEAEAMEAVRDAGLEPVVEGVHDEQVPKGTVVRSDPAGGTGTFEGEPVTLYVSQGPAPIEVPEVVGDAQSDAIATLEEAGLEPKVVAEEFSDSAPAGVVIGQKPAPGETLVRGDVVELTVSKGPRAFAMPDVRGKLREEAVGILEELGLEVHVREVPSIFVRKGEVAEQDPRPGSEVRKGDRVTLYVWK